MLPTSVTATTGMFAVLADPAMSHLDVTALFARLVQTSGHGDLLLLCLLSLPVDG